jgi:hypothetical protein
MTMPVDTAARMSVLRRPNLSDKIPGRILPGSEAAFRIDTR